MLSASRSSKKRGKRNPREPAGSDRCDGCWMPVQTKDRPCPDAHSPWEGQGMEPSCSECQRGATRNMHRQELQPPGKGKSHRNIKCVQPPEVKETGLTVSSVGNLFLDLPSPFTMSWEILVCKTHLCPRPVAGG